MNKFAYGTYDDTNTDSAFADNSYVDPISEAQTKRMLSYPLKELKDYINSTVNIDTQNNVVQLKLDYNNNALAYSLDGTSWEDVSFYGSQGETGEGVASGGTTGQVLVKASDEDYDTEWSTVDVQSQIDSAIRNIFPIGYVYISVSAVSPATYFGGTWTQITSDAYLKIVSSKGGQLGGTSSSHKIPLSSIPSHTHTVTDAYSTNDRTGAPSDTSYVNQNVISASTTRTTSSSGGGNAYYPYYLGVYVWKRTA